MDEISLDTGKYCFGVEDTFKALDLGAVEHLIIWENLDADRIVMRNNSTSKETVVHLTKEQQSNENFFHDAETGVELEIIEKETLVEWFANNYKNFGANLEYVTDRSGEGTQFVKGFGGIGGILRWKVDFVELSGYDEEVDNDGSDEESDAAEDDYGFDDGDFGF
mmetsp:Transcript_22008/g.32147  ORF Transcript_22008/g.32147 Transcript_22008/m.32147 type:complete len:165 (-) Transcript_22008:45-539(-)